jgi:hypothetical protein
MYTPSADASPNHQEQVQGVRRKGRKENLLSLLPSFCQRTAAEQKWRSAGYELLGFGFQARSNVPITIVPITILDQFDPCSCLF